MQKQTSPVVECTVQGTNKKNKKNVGGSWAKEGQRDNKRGSIYGAQTKRPTQIVLFSMLAACFIMLHFFDFFLKIKILFSIFLCRSRCELWQKTGRKPGGPSSSGQLGGAYTIVQCTEC